MAYILLFGIVLAIISIVIYLIKQNTISERTVSLTWGKCFSLGVQIYLISIFLGSLATSIVQNAYDSINLDFLKNVLSQTFGMLLYAVLFSFFIVVPALVLGLRSISKSSLSKLHKEIRFTAINILSVLIINLIMSGFLTNWEFLIFLSGFSLFGIVTPWAFVRLKKVFAQ